MKAWQISAPDTLEEITRQDNIESVSSSKVKVVKSLISAPDVYNYIGEGDIDYPVIPGRSAVGIVAETGCNCFGIEKNQRVYISPVSNCGECYNCKMNNTQDCTDILVAGETQEGYLKDFATLDCSQLFTLPESVSTDHALYIEHIALAIAIIDKLNISKGDHVSVIGAGSLGNILCQLIIYYQGVPILLDKDENYLKKAQSSGIYYTVKIENGAKSENVAMREVSDLTGGRMTEKSVYLTDCPINTKLPLLLTSFGGKIAFAGFNIKNIKIDFAPAMKKSLSIEGITDGFGRTEAAINILANKALNFSAFSFDSVGFNSIPKVFKEKAAQIGIGEKISDTIVNLL